MEISGQDVELIRYLKNYEYIGLDVVADYFQVSVRTLKGRLDNLRGLFKEYGITVEFLPGNKILIRGQENFVDLLNGNSMCYEMDFEKKLLLLLSLNRDYLTIQNIADQLFMSKSYVEKKLGSVVKKYPKEVSTQRHHGIRYAAGPVSRRDLYVRLMYPYLYGEDYEQSLEEFSRLHFPILDYFTGEQLRRAKEAIALVHENTWLSFTDESFRKLYLYLLFLIRDAEGGSGNESLFFRKKEDGLKGFREKVKEIEEKERQRLLGWICDVNTRLHLTDREEELYYICYLLASLRKQKTDIYDDIEGKMKQPVFDILEEIRDRLRIDFREDKELCRGLAVHIYTMLFRGNLMKEEGDSYTIDAIKRQYPLGFEMAVITADYIREAYGLSECEGDMIYLAFHYQVAIEKLRDEKPKIRLAIVTQYGNAANRLLRVKIMRRLPETEIVASCSWQEFLQAKEISCDLIVTTEKLLPTECPAVCVTLTLPERELKKLEETIDRMQVSRRLELLLMDAAILCLEHEENMEGIIRKMLCPLEERGAVGKEYLESVLKREKMSPTGFCHIATPHGNPEFVKEARLVIGRLKKPVQWGDSKVVCVFLFAASAELLRKTPQVFSTFYRVMVNPRIEEQIWRLQAEQDCPDEIFRSRLLELLV